MESGAVSEPTCIMLAVNQSTIEGGALEWTIKKIVQSNSSGFKCLFLHVQVPDDDDEDAFDDLDSIYASPDDFKNLKRKNEMRGLHLLQYFVNRCHEIGVPCEAWIKIGDPKEVICFEVRRVQPDLLVLGSRGLGPFQRDFVGTVSEFCAKHAECPVLTIKRSAAEPQDFSSAAVASSVTASAQPSPSHILNLPDHVMLQCLARIPFSYYFSCSLVSRSWHAAFKSPLLFSNRLLLGCTQNILYINLFRNSGSYTWYALDLNNHTKIQLPSLPSQPSGAASIVLGSKIYLLGGSIKDFSSKTVWVFDCRFRRWEMGPMMRVRRSYAATGVVNGKIYVAGGCICSCGPYSTNWSEVFDPATESWSVHPNQIEIMDKSIHENTIYGDAVLDYKIYVRTMRGGCLVYDDAVGKWSKKVPNELVLGWKGKAVLVGRILFCFDDFGNIIGYDWVDHTWKLLTIIEDCLPKKFSYGARMVKNMEDRLCIVWERKYNGIEKEICCAEIDVRRDTNGGLNGSVFWCDVILVVPQSSVTGHCIAVTV